jgi:uncharacterized repeat protein (TIGR03803 family)
MKTHSKLCVAALSLFISSVAACSAVQPEVFCAFLRGPSSGGGLTQGRDGFLYGTGRGGNNNLGTVFQVNTNGVVSVLVSFNGTNGANPQAGLLLASDGTLYGTTANGGHTDNGTVFQVTTDGALTRLVSFAQTNGANPTCKLAWGLDGALYGTTRYGGETGNGTVFQVTTNGILTTLASFNNTNGALPYPGLMLASDGNFYGTTHFGGTGGRGTVFRVTPEGELTTLFSFLLCDPNGALPIAGLVEGSDANLYGTTGGDCSNDGTVFRMTTNGVLTTLVSFSKPSAAFPYGTMVLGSDGNLFGTTILGGGNDSGTVFRITTNGVWTTLASSFGPYSSTGYSPDALVFGEDGSLYGTAAGGSGGNGTVFRLTTNGFLATYASLSDAEGSSPMGSLAQSVGSSFYGTTSSGGSNNFGTVFQLRTNGTLTSLLSFIGTNGANPQSTLILAGDGNFYGTTPHGGSTYTAPYNLGLGTVFRLTTNGVLTTVASFSGFADGSTPLGGLALGRDGALYGTTSEGGNNYAGTVFRITTNGVLTTLASFVWDRTNNPANSASRSLGTLVKGADDSFYGTTYDGGSHVAGTIFKVTTNGTLTILVSFNRYNGANPSAGLALGNDGNFYGTTSAGGSNNCGTIFKVSASGMLTSLVSFNGKNGANPSASLLLGTDGSFYGTTSAGGEFNLGTVFRASTNGTLTPLFSFNGANGANPSSELILSNDGAFYGATSGGGPGGRGTIFRVVVSSLTGALRLWSGSILLTGNGPPHSAYRLWATTNVSLPVPFWTPLVTNVFSTDGSFSYIDASAETNDSRFYQISIP